MKEIVKEFYEKAAAYIVSKKERGETITGKESRAFANAEFAAELYGVPKIKTNFVTVTKKVLQSKNNRNKTIKQSDNDSSNN